MTINHETFLNIMQQREMLLFWLAAGVAFALLITRFSLRIIPAGVKHWQSRLNQLTALPKVPHLKRLKIPFWPMLIIAALLLRLPRLNDAFWYDETFSAAIARVPLENLPAAIMGDVHPPLNYLIQWLTVRVLGLNEITLRLPALICGLWLIVLMYQFARALGLSRAVARTAAVLVALLPTAIYYSNEARQYSLLACLALVACIAILRDQPRCFAVAGALLPLTHNIGYVYLAVLGVGVFLIRFNFFRWCGTRGRRYLPAKWWRALWFAGGAAGAWLPFMLKQSGDVADGFWLWSPNVGTVFKTLLDTTLGTRILPALLFWLYGLFIALLLLSLWTGRKLITFKWVVWAALVAGVPAALAIVSVLWRPVYLQRALLAPGLALTIPLAVMLVHRRQSRLAMGALIALALVGYFHPDVMRIDLRRYFAPCAAADNILYTSPSTAIQGQMYAPDVPQYLWSQANDLSQTLPPDAKAAMGLVSADLEDFHGTVCIPVFYNPMQGQAEKDMLQYLLRTYPYEAQMKPINEFYTYVVYTFRLG